MNYNIFILSLIGLCVAALSAFIMSFRTRSWPLAVFVPLIALCGSFIYFSYTAVLGFPVCMEWDQLPERITVLFFRVDGRESISLWLLERENTRLVELPYRESAEEGLDKALATMGKGIPVTFKRSEGAKSGSGSGKGKAGASSEKGKRGKGQGKGQSQGKGKAGQRGHGWRYKVESKGNPIPGGSMPAKPYGR